MKISAINALSERQWIDVQEIEGLEVCIVPARASDVLSLTGAHNRIHDRQVCQHAFVDFRGVFEDDGTPSANTLETRISIYEVIVIRNAIGAALITANEAATLGEGDAASD